MSKSSREILQDNGYSYSGDCSGCGGKYSVYKNTAFPEIEIKVKKTDSFTKIYKNGALIAHAGSANLLQKLTENAII